MTLKIEKYKNKLLKQPILKLIKLYQKYISPDTGVLQIYFPFGACKYHPTCSSYTYQAVDKYGIIKGSFLGMKRILRCNPFSKGGFDPLD